jgi:hypothetical protein
MWQISHVISKFEKELGTNFPVTTTTHWHSLMKTKQNIINVYVVYEPYGDQASIGEDRNHGAEDKDLQRKYVHRQEHY